MNDPVVIVTTTVTDGTVVRWHRDVRAAELHRPVLSASRNGVAVHAEYLTCIPDEWVDAAKRAHKMLRDVRGANLGHLATHHVRGLGAGPVEPITREASGG